MKQFMTGSGAFIIKEGCIVFIQYEFPGMVGETYLETKAILVNQNTMEELRGSVIQLNYEDIKSFYCQIKDKNERIAYYGFMKSMSPETIKANSEYSHNVAISCVI